MMRAVWLRWSFRVTSLRSTLQPGITTFSEHRALLDETKIISDRLRTTFCGLNGDCPGSPDATRHVVARQPSPATGTHTISLEQALKPLHRPLVRGVRQDGGSCRRTAQDIHGSKAAGVKGRVQLSGRVGTTQQAEEVQDVRREAEQDRRVDYGALVLHELEAERLQARRNADQLELKLDHLVASFRRRKLGPGLQTQLARPADLHPRHRLLKKWF
mmetsp:Transcript_45274/g.119483  ORF Transcript_45274/g.119483 Transcript_45274/m.119483 type:complete len:216 (+) Transcript_45274:3-650(+)